MKALKHMKLFYHHYTPSPEIYVYSKKLRKQTYTETPVGSNVTLQKETEKHGRLSFSVKCCLCKLNK